MDNQILHLLTDMQADMKSMNTEIKSMKTEMKSMKTEMHNRFDTVDAKLEGVGGQFELTNESRINEVDFIVDKVNKMEKEIYILKNKSNI